MARQAIKFRPPNLAPLRAEAKAYKRAIRDASLFATDLGGQRAFRRQQAMIKSVGLGNLSKAVGWTSAKKKGQTGATPYAAIYAKGAKDSRAAQALEAYSKGVTIKAVNGEWLAFATGAIPSRVGRKKITPKLYNNSGLASSIGKLIFRKIKPNLALLVVRNVSLSPKTGRAKALGPRGTRTRIVPEKDTVAFVLIRQTRRARRWDKDAPARLESGRVPLYMKRWLDQNYR